MNKEEFFKRIEEEAHKLKRLRGNVVHNALDIEYGISAILINYYIKDEIHNEFLIKGMADEYFSFGLKIRIFQKTFPKEPYQGFFEDVRRIVNIRNILAHSPMFGFNGKILSNKNLKIEIKEAQELHDEFYKLHPKVLNELNKLLQIVLTLKN